MSEDDVWDEITKSVTPMKKEKTKSLAKHEPKKIAKPSKPAAVPKQKVKMPEIMPEIMKDPIIKPKPALAELSAGDAINMDKSTAQKLKRGQMPIEGRLDLHGMTQQQAHSALDEFIDHAYHAGKRCVIVITGKGGVSKENKGVLRQRTPAWLNLPQNRSKILGFTAAQPKDGGSGALYVLLKRRR